MAEVPTMATHVLHCFEYLPLRSRKRRLYANEDRALVRRVHWHKANIDLCRVWDITSVQVDLRD